MIRPLLAAVMMGVGAMAQAQEKGTSLNEFFFTDAAPFRHLTFPGNPTAITFSPGISIDTKTGRVTIPPNLSLDDASRAFWRAVESMGMGRLQDCPAKDPNP